VLKRWIGLELRRLRKEAGKSRPEVATRIGQSRTAVGHLETARNLPAKLVLEALLEFYGVPERVPFFLNLIEAARKGRNWWDQLIGAAPAWFDLYLGLEAGAAELDIWEAMLVPGLLQTDDYAEAVFRADPDLRDEEIHQRLELRRGRQTILDREDDPVRLWVVIDEAVLYRVRGNPLVQAAQIEHLLKVVDQPRLDLQVLPRDAGAHLAQQSSFTLMKFPAEMVGDPGAVFVDTLVESRYYEEPEEIEAYERAMTRLQVVAAKPADSRSILSRAAKEVAR
jgi:transcriptional regulator with XRE-family HTH domain